MGPLDEHNKFLLLTLDEIDYYIRTTGEDIVYELTRLTDAVTNVPQRINFLFIARDHSFMDVMSPESSITEVNTENNLSDKRYEQERRYQPYRQPRYGGSRYGERRGYQRRRY